MLRTCGSLELKSWAFLLFFFTTNKHTLNQINGLTKDNSTGVFCAKRNGAPLAHSFERFSCQIGFITFSVVCPTILSVGFIFVCTDSDHRYMSWMEVCTTASGLWMCIKTWPRSLSRPTLIFLVPSLYTPHTGKRFLDGFANRAKPPVSFLIWI